jgi:hypothetical protein
MGSAPSPGARPPVSASQLADVAREYLITQHGPLNRPVEVVVTFDAHLQFVRAFITPLPLPPPPPKAEEPGHCLLNVVALLARENRRLTTDQIFAGLARQGTPHGDSTVRKTLAKAVDDGYLNNRSDATPRGYGLSGLSGWDKRDED